MELDLEAWLMGETLVLNRSSDLLYGDYIELNDLNVPLELRRDQVDDLMPTIEEGEIASLVGPAGDPSDQRVRSQLIGKDLASGLLVYELPLSIKTNHAHAVVHDLEDTLELAEITRKKMLEKMKSPLCVEKKIKIAPLDYSKENYLETFTPQRQLSAE
nr:hypothetical protein [Tanacetum cinerariifolium]